MVKSIKYLGITLDNKLNWAEHINDKIDKARKLLFKIRSTCRKTWGPAPEMMLWAYQSVVRPVLSYGSLVFSHKLSSNNKTKLTRLQNLALMMLGNFRRGTPGHGLNLITGTIPLDLFIQREAIQSSIRIRDKFKHDWDGLSQQKKISKDILNT